MNFLNAPDTMKDEKKKKKKTKKNNLRAKHQ